MKGFTAVVYATTLAAAFAVPQGDGKMHCTGACQKGDPNAKMHKVMAEKKLDFDMCYEESRLSHGERGCPTVRPSIANEPCEDSMAGEYPCENVDMFAFISVEDMDSTSTNDIWGWTDEDTGHEIAIVALRDGTSFVDVTDPRTPVVLAKLDTHTGPSSWRDIKVFRNVAYIGSEASGHGLQIFDMTTLREFYGKDARGKNIRHVKASGHYGEFGNSHNVALNEDTGHIFVIGSGTCSAGPHMLDVSADPLNPEFIGCAGEDGYTHDAECVTYSGPDTAYTGNEICFLYNENTLTITDVTDKANPTMLSRVTYDNVYYTHQGWLTEDQSHLFLDDELDESNGPNQNTRTMIWDVNSLANPTLVDSFFSTETVIDHNQYVNGSYVYQANYCAGLRVLEIDDAGAHPELTEVGYFKVDPDCNTPTFRGSWSVYPYFRSGVVILTSIERGFFTLDPSAALAQKKKALRLEPGQA